METTATTTTTKPRVRWFVRPDGSDEWLPRQASMRGAWGNDAKCSCGWESRTGGATLTAVRRMVSDHFAIAHDTFRRW